MAHTDARTTESIAARFDVHPASPEQQRQHQRVREACKALAGFLADNVPAGRERSLAFTKLEETMMWANKGVAQGGGK
ncbi:hypothetical protein GS462_11290 [Rhodococcus hoagii]|nr:hypothetical protein [Prescottella equi]MBM4650996.1 hypothetical protein [Prescottella equi]MBM4686657.1 hypothetical protein [Prescottella equi]